MKQEQQQRAGTASRASAGLDDDLIRRMDAWWRAANYLSVGQIYLLDNPLLKQPLGLELGTAVGVQRQRRIILAIRAALCAVEDIVGRHVQETAVRLERSTRERLDAGCIHGQGALRLGLRPLDLRVARGVHDHVGVVRAHAAADRGSVRDV